MDTTARLGVEDASRAAFQPAPEKLALGFTASAAWLRVWVLPHPTDPDAGVLLRVRPSYLDHVQLWERDARWPGGWRGRVSGDLEAFSSSDRSYNALAFMVHPAVGGQHYWLRVASTSTLLVHAEALTLADAHRKDGRLALLHLVCIGWVVCVLCWALHAWWAQRMALAGWFVLFLAGSVMYLLTITGLVSLLEPDSMPGLTGRLGSYAILLNHALVVWLHRQVLSAYGARGWSMTLLTVVPLLQLLAFPAHALGWERESLRLGASLLLPAALLIIAIALRVRSQPLLPPSAVLKTLHVAMFLVNMPTLLPVLGLQPGPEWSLHTNLLHGTLTALFMLALLWWHARLRDAEQRLQAEGVQRLQRQVEHQHQRAEDNRQFIDMLTHEVKTPLSIALMGVGALRSDSPHIARIRRALRDINAVVDRTRLSDLAEHQRLQPSYSSVALRELLFECTESSTAPERLKVLAGDVPEVRTDPDLLAIVINNLLDNALKYSPADSPVEVHLDATPDGVRLSVANATGAAGQPDAQRVFSKYYRAPGAQAKRGSGLGLYLSHQLAGLLRVQLHYRPQPGRVEFVLCLPV